ncbi:hypothetical protein K7432_015466, partial [Basidiobolus ranarum]
MTITSQEPISTKDNSAVKALNNYRNPQYIQGFKAHPERRNLLEAATRRTDLTPSIGTELEGLQLAKLTDAQLEDLLALIAERGVVFFRDQDLD